MTRVNNTDFSLGGKTFLSSSCDAGTHFSAGNFREYSFVRASCGEDKNVFPPDFAGTPVANLEKYKVALNIFNMYIRLRSSDVAGFSTLACGFPRINKALQTSSSDCGFNLRFAGRTSSGAKTFLSSSYDAAISKKREFGCGRAFCTTASRNLTSYGEDKNVFPPNFAGTTSLISNL